MSPTDFSFIPCTDNHLMETKDKIREGICSGKAMQMMMCYISDTITGKAEISVSTLLRPDRAFSCIEDRGNFYAGNPND